MNNRRQKFFEKLVRYQKAQKDHMKVEHFSAGVRLERAEQEVEDLRRQQERLFASPNLDPNTEHWTPTVTYSALNLSESMTGLMNRASRDVHSARQSLAEASTALMANYARQKKYETTLEVMRCEIDKQEEAAALNDAYRYFVRRHEMVHQIF